MIAQAIIGIFSGNSVLDCPESIAIFHPVQMCDANGQQAPEAGSTRLGFPAHL